MINDSNSSAVIRSRKNIGFISLAGQFLQAVIVATVTGCLIQTHINLAALSKLGADIPLALRLDVTLQDLLGFGPVYFAIVFTAFIPALALANFLARRFHRLHHFIYLLAGALSLMITFTLLDALAPMPTLIAATRGYLGTLLMMTGGSLGSWIFGFRYREPSND